MILLLGGTSETAVLAGALAAAGHKVIVSTATDARLTLPNHPLVSRRCGRLDAGAMRALLRELCAWAVVDATHPYAIQAQANARKASHDANIPYFRWLRAETALDELDGVAVAGGHQEAARLAFSYGCTVLLTVGSRNIEPYAREARRTGIDVFARVLPLPDSRAACREAGLPESAISAGRGPFSLTENRSVIRRVGAGVLVTKDGGAEGGMPAKLEAARIEGCRLVVVRRPAVDIPDGQSFQSIISLLQALPRLR